MISLFQAQQLEIYCFFQITEISIAQVKSLCQYETKRTTLRLSRIRNSSDNPELLPAFIEVFINIRTAGAKTMHARRVTEN